MVVVAVYSNGNAIADDDDSTHNSWGNWKTHEDRCLKFWQKNKNVIMKNNNSNNNNNKQERDKEKGEQQQQQWQQKQQQEE